MAQFYDGYKYRNRYCGEKKPYSSAKVIAQFVFVTLALLLWAAIGPTFRWAAGSLRGYG